MTVTRKELSEQLSRRCGLSKRAASEAVDAMIEHIKASLERGEKVALRSFGSLTPVTRPPRKAHDPKRGVLMQLPSRSDVRWRSSKVLRARLDDARREDDASSME